MGSIPISPACRKFNLDLASAVDFSVLHLNPAKHSISICHQVERSVLRQGIQNREPLLKQIKLSLQNSQVTLLLRVVHNNARLS